MSSLIQTPMLLTEWCAVSQVAEAVRLDVRCAGLIDLNFRGAQLQPDTPLQQTGLTEVLHPAASLMDSLVHVIYPQADQLELHTDIPAIEPDARVRAAPVHALQH